MVHRLRALFLLGLLAFSTIAAFVPRQALAEPSKQDSADIQLSVQPFFEGNYRFGSWLPLRITVANSGTDIDATISMVTPSGPSYETPVELPRGANKTLVLYTQPTGTFRRTATVRVMVDGQQVKQAETQINGFTSNTQMFGILSEQPLTLAVPGGNPQTQKIESIKIDRVDLPARAEGLSMFDVIMIDGAPLADLAAEQQLALADWVRAGGQVVVGGTKLDVVLTQLPEQFRIATIGEAVSTGPISILPELSATIAHATELIAAEGALPVATSGATVVGVQREFGAGRITLLGFSLSAPELTNVPAKSPAWTQILKLRSDAPEQWGMQPPAEMQAQQLGFALTTLPVLARPPLGLLIGLLGAYILIVGPGLYFLLRRLDRQAWGWVAIPLVTLLFALGAYGYGLQMRGDDIILNQISIVEPAEGRSRVRSFGGIFSPRTTTYQVKSQGDALFKPMIGGDFGPMPTQTIGGHFVQGGNGVRDLQVAQWSMNTFAAEHMIDGEPLVAEVILADGVLRGSVRNTGTLPLQDVAVFQGSRVAKIGTLQPGESKDVELKLPNNDPITFMGPISMQLLSDQWDFNKPAIAPTDVRMKQTILDAMFSTPYGGSTAPTAIGWMEQAPLGITVESGRVKQQQTSLVIASAAVSYASNTEISVPRGWISPQHEVTMVNGGGPCISQFGNGWYLDTGVMTSTLQLPPTLQSLNINEATVFVQSEGPLPPTMKVDLFDWQGSEWIAQPDTLTTFPVSDTERFISDNAAVKVRLNLQNALQGGGGCLTTSLSLKGQTP